MQSKPRPQWENTSRKGKFVHKSALKDSPAPVFFFQDFITWSQFLQRKHIQTEGHNL